MLQLFEAMNHETRNAHLILMNNERAYKNVVAATKELQLHLENARTSNAYVASKRVYTKRLREIYAHLDSPAMGYDSALIVWPCIVDLLMFKYDQGELV